jgi:post-segregation antitoxin (ccd killing protein)
MRMARVNVYLPDELANEARDAGLNISGVAQDALRRALASRETESWLDRLDAGPSVAIDHASVLRAIDEARDELGDSD